MPGVNPAIPMDDHIVFRQGPFDGQKFRIPFGKPRTIDCALPVGNQTVIYAPVWINNALACYEFREVIDSPQGVTQLIGPDKGVTLT